VIHTTARRSDLLTAAVMAVMAVMAVSGPPWTDESEAL
jgi:hypothetical protein